MKPWMNRGEASKRIETLKASIAQNPDRYWEYPKLGEAYRRSGMENDAIEAFQAGCDQCVQIAARNGEESALYETIGRCMQEVGNAEEARNAYEKAESMSPGRGRRCLDEASQILVSGGDLEGAMNLLSSAAGEMPTNGWPQRLMAIVYHHVGMHEKAAECCIKAEALGYADQEVYILMFISFAEAGQPIDAIRAFDLAFPSGEIATAQPMPMLIKAIAACSWYTGFKQQAIGLLEELLRKMPDYLDAAIRLAFMKNAIGDKRGAREICKTVSRLNPNVATEIETLLAEPLGSIQ